MLHRIIQYSLKNKVIVLLGTLVLAAWGTWSALRIPIDAVPDITNNQVQIITTSPTLAAQEVEQFVTYPIEQSLATLPDLTELRSISRFGLSVITAVFDDKVDIYFARQLINEKLKEAEEEIPPGAGRPELAPVSTGLGEIYQYILHPKEGTEEKYSPMDLRTMQDWIVARQLYGTPGVAEVNSFGGFLKQYEVAVNPDRLKAMNVTIPEIFHALEKNNQNTGGAYIDKEPHSYFIRALGLLHSIDEIGEIAIKTDGNGLPVLMKDVAEIRIAPAVRYGALTYNGEKEAVSGIVMMLKDANSAEVIRLVKEKMEVIRASLPDDIEIEAYSDRTQLIQRTIRTVQTNLLEGALIVIFVLILFLGNLRSGLIVASVIPLSMLFALGMMQLFGVSANLMSLGAIDFGLIVDGAVIIVEATLHILAAKKITTTLSRKEMDAVVEESAEKMMNSAAFGQIIILIVYLPVLSLRGIEGKMFAPMAQTVSFAIIGALILSLTYIPVMSALFISRKPNQRKTAGDRMMQFFQRIYDPAIRWAIRRKVLVVTSASALLGLSVWMFSRTGGEFLPQLGEGDYAFHCILPQGTSLTQSIETSMQAQRIIKSFPEVLTVVGKTGTAEIATDPMPPEATDLIITLKPMKEWTTTRDYDELSRLMMEALQVIPGVFFEASQPIQMRFNELMTGVRQDVAIKIFGENIDTLAALAPRIHQAIRGIDGVVSPQIERTTGLPQITIEYDRVRMANYGLNIEDVNRTIRTAFAGEAAGVIFEDEKKFDLVVRLDDSSRSSIEDVGNLFVGTEDGHQIPLDQIAAVSVKEGPAQISREDGKRRIVIGFNVEDRDVESVVKEIREKLSGMAYQLPTGYYLTYGGTFQNLKEATARLSIAVPAAMLLIFILLYFTFHSLREALLIYTAIPMSAIGGIFALILRGMPFTISAGVGFIALFGVAVLNGIVLISTFDQLKKEGMNDIRRRVLEGTKIRLRPVLMTATVASLGFLPMALNTGAGAEVQKPLATVVIGGLVTATILTLIVLPCLYILFSGKQDGRSGLPKATGLSLLFLLFTVGSIHAQHRIGPEAAVDTALKYNLHFEVNEAEILRAKKQVKTAGEFPKTEFFLENEDMHPSEPAGVWKLGISQSIRYPGLYKARREYFSEQLKKTELRQDALKMRIRKEVRMVYYELWYLQDLENLYRQLDSIYTSLYETTGVRYRHGEIAGLEQYSKEMKMKEVRAYMRQNQFDIKLRQEELAGLLNKDIAYLPVSEPLEKIPFVPVKTETMHPYLLMQKQNTEIAAARTEVQKNMNKPDFSGRVFSQRLWGGRDPYTGFSVTAAFPLIGARAYKNKVQEAEAAEYTEQRQLILDTREWDIATQNAGTETARIMTLLDYYETSGLRLADKIMHTATISFEAGEISFVELSQFLSQAIDIKTSYLKVLNQYNQAVINYQFHNNQ